jgi:hypothetical protein
VEDKLATQDVVQEDADELRNQINIMKVIALLLLLLLLLLLNSKPLIMLIMMIMMMMMTMTMMVAGVVAVMTNGSVVGVKRKLLARNMRHVQLKLI